MTTMIVRRIDRSIVRRQIEHRIVSKTRQIQRANRHQNQQIDIWHFMRRTSRRVPTH
jgi:hypothetical protein